MTKSISFCLLLILTTTQSFNNSHIAKGNLMVEPSGINFFQGTLLEARAKAHKENKLVFIDCYTTWCGPCISMSKKIFVKKEVGEFYNKNFVCIKIDMDLDEGIALHNKYDVDVYPTYLFIDPKGVLRHRGLGFIDSKKLIALGQMALTK